MATKKIRLPVTVHVADDAKSTPERRLENGLLIEAARTVHKAVPAGTPVTLDAEEADALLMKFGPYKETVIVTEGEVPGIPAPISPPTVNARR